MDGRLGHVAVRIWVIFLSDLYSICPLAFCMLPHLFPSDACWRVGLPRHVSVLTAMMFFAPALREALAMKDNIKALMLTGAILTYRGEKILHHNTETGGLSYSDAYIRLRRVSDG